MYDAFYGLSGRPFQLTPDPHFYFESGTHRKALSYLGYGLAQGEGFIVITGDIGAGKTTLVGHLMATVDKARLSVANIVTTQLDAADITRMAAQSFGLDVAGRDKAAVLDIIEQYLHAEARAGRRSLLIVDEAQNLPVAAIEELRMLSNFQLGNQALLQIFLLGQPEFRDMVQNAPELEQLRQRVIATHHLDPMAADEIQPYIEHRMSKVGWNGRPKFSSDVFPCLFEETGGVPRKLNSLISRVLLLGAVEQRDEIDAGLVHAVVADLRGEVQPETKVEPIQAPKQAENQIVEEATQLEPVTAPSVENLPEDDVDDLAYGATNRSIGLPEEPADASLQMAQDRAKAELLGSVALSDFDMAIDRIAGLESRLADQEATMRRVLSMLIQWVESDEREHVGRIKTNRAA